MHNLMRMVDAIDQVTGRRPNLSTAWRWSTTGIEGIRLETVVLGGKRLCTVEMVEAFIAATTAAKNATYQTQYVAPTKSREKQIAKATADLQARFDKRKKQKA